MELLDRSPFGLLPLLRLRRLRRRPVFLAAGFALLRLCALRRRPFFAGAGVGAIVVEVGAAVARFGARTALLLLEPFLRRPGLEDAGFFFLDFPLLRLNKLLRRADFGEVVAGAVVVKVVVS